MRRIAMRYWNSTFARFIRSYGVVSLATELEVRPSAIYHWIRGSTTPRPAHAEIIKRLARERGCRLTMDEIYGHSRAVRTDHTKLRVRLGSKAAEGTFASSPRHI
jgi:hypothetical protein